MSNKLKPLKRKPNKVWKLLKSPKRWTQFTYAKTADGVTCLADEPNACVFCLVGAVTCVYPERLVYDVLATLRSKLPTSVYSWNDERGRTHKEVFDLVKKLDV